MGDVNFEILENNGDNDQHRNVRRELIDAYMQWMGRSQTTHYWHWRSPNHLPSLGIPGTIWNPIMPIRICQTTDKCMTLVLCCILWEPSVTSTPIFKLMLNRLSCHEGNAMPYLCTILCICHMPTVSSGPEIWLLQWSKWNFNYLSGRTLSEEHFPHSRVLVDATFLELQGILSRREGKL